MALRIRMTRGGAKKRPHYRIVVADSRFPRDGRFIEIVGTHNPLCPKDHVERVVLKEDRIKHWLSVGALPSDRVNRFLDAAGIMKREPRNNPIKAQPGQKRLDREEEKKKAAEAAKTAPAEEPATEEPAADAPSAEEAHAEEPATEEPAADAPSAEAAVPEEAPAADAEEPSAAEPEPAPEAEEAPSAEAGDENKEDAAD